MVAFNFKAQFADVEVDRQKLSQLIRQWRAAS